MAEDEEGGVLSISCCMDDALCELLPVLTAGGVRKEVKMILVGQELSPWPVFVVGGPPCLCRGEVGKSD